MEIFLHYFYGIWEVTKKIWLDVPAWSSPDTCMCLAWHCFPIGPPRVFLPWFPPKVTLQLSSCPGIWNYGWE